VSQYRYQVVSGPCLWAREQKTLAAARSIARCLAGRGFGPYEVERVLELDSGGRRYWVQEGRRWVAENACIRTPQARRAWHVTDDGECPE
jgi:hypothetical protein